MTLKEKMFLYFEQNPIDDFAENKYAKVLKKFNVSLKVASNYWNIYKKRQSLKNNKKETTSYGDGLLHMDLTVQEEIKNIDDLVRVCDIDLTKYKVLNWRITRWDAQTKKDGHVPFYSVKATFQPIPIEQNLSLQKDVLLRLVQEKSKPSSFSFKNNKKKHLLEIDIFDMHFGKLAHREEVGEDYDISIAEERWNKAIESLLNRVNLDNVELILLPIGNDLFNIDNSFNQTTAGTPQDSDSRFHKIVRVVKRILIDTISKLEKITPIEVLIVPGNHDEHVTFMLGDILDAYFYNNENVRVYNNAKARKYYKYGTVGLMYTHGNNEKFNDLGMIFAAENPSLWAATTQRYIKIGHFHHNKLQVMQRQEFQGFQIQIIPSLSGSDAWHSKKGYNSLKQAKAFLYDKDEGLIGEYTYTA